MALETLRADRQSSAVAQVDLQNAVVDTGYMSCTESVEVVETMVIANGNRRNLVAAVVVDLEPAVGCDSTVVRQSVQWSVLISTKILDI